MTPLQFELPFPPSVNTYWRNIGRTILSAPARKYHSDVISRIFWQTRTMAARPRLITWPVAVKATLHPPNRHRRDLDNLIKAILDSLTRAGVWKDDSLVHELHLAWGEIVKGGKAIIQITKLGESGFTR